LDSLGLFPAPNASTADFEVLGVLCAKAILMECVLDINFNPAFIRLLRGEAIDLEKVDGVLARSLLSLTGTESLDFTYPGYPEIEMIPEGAMITVEPERIEEYCALIRQFTCGEKRFEPIMNAFLQGFNAVLPFGRFECLAPEEFCTLISGERTPFTEAQMRQEINFIGFTDLDMIESFIRVVSKMSPLHQSCLLQFVTGSPHAPVGGLKAFQPRISVAHKSCALATNSPLPTASTCSNQLKLPDYDTEEVLLEKLTLAIMEGQETFAWT
jgi:E3 ubiquitin-protein ligase TRIP12